MSISLRAPMRFIIAGLLLCLPFSAANAQTSVLPGVDVQSVEVAPGVYGVRASNHWWGPVQLQVKLSVGSQNVKSSLNLPQRWEVSSRLSRELFQVSTKDPGKEGTFGLEVMAVPGSPRARHRADHAYHWPLPANAGRLDQGFGGSHSHADAENYYAIDIAAPPNTTVFASRAGVVMAAEGRFTKSGIDPALKSQANYVRILQEDGTMAVYVHLAPNSIKVSPGQVVSVGQALGAVGQTGFASGPHLHFAVQVNSDMALKSVPFKMYQPKNAASNLSPARSY